jgi:hypothetical protein
MLMRLGLGESLLVLVGAARCRPSLEARERRGMNNYEGDPVAAAVHRARAEEAWQAAAKFAKLGLPSAHNAALAAARREDRIAEMLETGRERG